MAALILKSGNALNADVDSLDFTFYKNRVLSDGGIIVDERAAKDAIIFALANGITPSQVYSATSARWGVKLFDGKPSKFYSLFGESGDIVATIGSSSAIDYNGTRYEFPVLELRASRNNILKTQKPVDEVKSTGLCIIAKPPILSSSASYGAEATSFALAGVADISPSSDTDVALRKRVHDLLYKRGAVADMPNEWGYLGMSYGTSTKIDTYATTPMLKGVQSWSHVTTFANKTSLDFYNNGSLLRSAPSTQNTAYNDNLSMTLGLSKGTSSIVDYGNAAYVDIAEAWCLINITTDKMQALSLRASQKYIS